MKNLISLRLKIYFILSALVLITLMGGTVMVWYTFRMERVLNLLIEKDVAAFQAAESLEAALVNQKGFVTYYFLDNDPDWLGSWENSGRYSRKDYPRQSFYPQMNLKRKL